MKKILFWAGLALALNFSASFCFADVTWEPDVRLTNDPASSYTSLERSIATDSQNRVHVVWYDSRDGNREIYYKRSLDGGQTWESDVRLTVNGSSSSYPSIATDSQNRVHVVWIDSRDGNNPEVYYKRSLDGGQTWESDVRLTVNMSYSYYPIIATDPQNRVHVVWYDDRDGGYNLEVYYKRSLDGGQTWESDVRLTVNSAESFAPSIATDSQNRVHVVWQDYRDGKDQIYYKRSLDGGQTWGSDVRLTVNNSYSRDPSITTDSQNRVHVGWYDYRDGNSEIYYKRSLDGGNTWDNDMRLTVDTSSSWYPSIAADSKNGIHVVWQDERDGNDEIYYKRSLDGGQTWENDVGLTVNNGDSETPAIVTDSQNRVHVVWNDNRDGNWEIYYKRGTQDRIWKVFGPVHR